MAACSAAIATAGAAAVGLEKKPKVNKLTITQMDFEGLLEDPTGDAWFRANLRCSKITFQRLVDLLASKHFAFRTTSARKHSYAKRVGSVLYFYASSGSYHATAAAMGMNESVLFEAIDDLTEFLVILLPEVIAFPDLLDGWRRMEAQFKEKQGIPGITGAIDGSLVQIQRPDDYEGFYCRKCYPAINIQAIVDPDVKFMSVDLFPGSWSDKKMWKFAPSSRQYCAKMPIETHLLGDSGYTLLPWLIVPYLEREESGRLSRQQKLFNFKHSSTRMTVERTFGKWKGRFHRLNVMAEKTVSKACSIIAATMVLHNLFEMLVDDTPIEAVREPVDPTIAEPDEFSAGQLRAIAKSKRDRLMPIVIS